jgi:hypothetical protein
MGAGKGKVKPVELPIQPLYFDERETLRFTPNRLVRLLLDWSSTVRTNNETMDMNRLAVVAQATTEEWAQFAQLIGYSFEGWGGLSYVSDETFERAAVEADKAKKGAKGVKKKKGRGWR